MIGHDWKETWYYLEKGNLIGHVNSILADFWKVPNNFIQEHSALNVVIDVDVRPGTICG